MSNVPHEEAAKKTHPRARQFTPVRSAFSRVLGWTFEIPQEGSHAIRHGWVTLDCVVSSDSLSSRLYAQRNLKAFLKSRKGSSGSIHAQNTGSATATGDGDADTGISSQ
ncbi:hypothetical protein [Streptomyces sp. 5-10]|uniref:hypothetical protein n=1 Tax=Streptomyces sp. 5-10 TaxID=878925 RepID=UPI00168A9A75|nr:hypothetical protein [Streptomyces sp. 5-10]MBD3004791.1 hypothetical protein [Streptomyces sp. 5-10]